MRTVSILYEDPESLERSLKKEVVIGGQNCLVMIYTADASKDEAVAIAGRLKTILPDAQIVGASASGIIYRGRQIMEGTLIMIYQCEQTLIFTQAFTWKGKSALQFASEVAASIEGEQVPLMHILFGDHYYDVHDFVEAFNCLETGVRLAGGVAGDVLPKNIDGFVFTPEGVIENGAVIAAFGGEKVHVYEGVNIAHEPISPVYRLTSAEGSCWNTVGDESADAWIQRQLGIESFGVYDDWQGIAANDTMIHFPVLLEGHHGASRFLRYDAESQKIAQYFSCIPEDTEFRIGYVNPVECVKEAFRICNEVMLQPVESLFCYNCLFRRLYLHNCAEWEISPYTGTDICGAFMMGEIACVGDTNEFLNGSCVLVGVAEKHVHIRPDLDVFMKLNTIADDTGELLNFVLKKQSENISRYNEELLGKLMRQQREAQKQLYTDFNTGIGNYMQFRNDNERESYDKLCMVRVDNADLITRQLGREGYLQVIREAVRSVKIYLENSECSGKKLLSLYMFNDDSFFVVADNRIGETHFISLCKKMFEEFQIIKVKNAKQLLVTRYVLVIREKTLIEHALNGFDAARNTQIPFFICRKGKSEQFSAEEEFKILSVLIRALEQDGIVPYFQGVYDNVEKKISKYEALMRIVDWDGTVYCPAQFMEIAKKYHLYIHLSQVMMDKIFYRFTNCRETVGINFSAFDISSDEMRGLILEKLRNIGDGSNFILEIVEDEKFTDLDVLRCFVEEVREYGVRIAIDDFGTGYSNLLEIASIKPDYIKVDGEIIRTLPASDVSRKLLDVIVYMGKLFHADIVAEYVEDEEIQELVMKNCVRYSQGYYFSRPCPFIQVDE